MAVKNKIRGHYLERSKLPPFEVGTPVIVCGPCLWSGAAGEIESYNPETTLHVVKMKGKNGETFRGEATSECLKLDL